MKVVRLIHWNAAEGEEKAEMLKALGYQVLFEVLRGPDSLRRLRSNPPHAIVIDLSRLPSQGRDLALMLRRQKSTRAVPLVFAGGDPEKVDRIRKILPDAIYCAWSRMRSSMRGAIACAPGDPVVPRSIFDGYAGVSLPKKLGIKSGSAVSLVDAPKQVDRIIGDLPEGARLIEKLGRPFDLMLWFVRSLEGLHSRIKAIGASIGDKPLWIIWPKKTSNPACDLSQAEVRRAGLAEGLVDYKICAVDETWSGLLFRRRR